MVHLGQNVLYDCQYNLYVVKVKHLATSTSDSKNLWAIIFFIRIVCEVHGRNEWLWTIEPIHPSYKDSASPDSELVKSP